MSSHLDVEGGVPNDHRMFGTHTCACTDIEENVRIGFPWAIVRGARLDKEAQEVVDSERMLEAPPAFSGGDGEEDVLLREGFEGFEGMRVEWWLVVSTQPVGSVGLRVSLGDGIQRRIVCVRQEDVDALTQGQPHRSEDLLTWRGCKPVHLESRRHRLDDGS